MSTVCRRILRNESRPVMVQVNTRRADVILAKLASDRSALRRGLTKLRRAFNMVSRRQASIDRREKQLRDLGR